MMNREILFKAKRKDNGEWVEGYYLNIAKINHFICTGKIKLDGALKGIIAPEMYAIDPDTICQYTGLTDKNGQKIWENDIISISAYSYYEPEDDYFGVVTYCEKDVCWCLKNREESSEEVICECFGSYTTEIINHGNIFDNADLLEVE